MRLPRAGFAKDSVEVEGYVRGFARRRPDVAVTMLRFANIMGPGIDTPLTRYLSLPVVPDRARVRRAAAADPRGRRAGGAGARRPSATLPGTYNVAGDGVLMLSQAVARAGRVNLPLPTAARLGRARPRAAIRLHRLHVRADRVPEVRTRCRHHADRRNGSGSRRRTPPARRSTRSCGRTPWVGCSRGTLSAEPDEATVTTIGGQARMSDAQVIPLNPDREAGGRRVTVLPRRAAAGRCAPLPAATRSRAATRSTSSASTASSPTTS